MASTEEDGTSTGREDASIDGEDTYLGREDTSHNGECTSTVGDSTSICAVCEEVIDKPRVHYGGVCCYSCRGFFR